MAFAQQKTFIQKVFSRAPYDTNYVDSYYNYFLHVTAVSVQQNHDLIISNSSNNTSFNYKPNSVFRFGVGLDFRYFSIEFTKSIDAIDKPNASKGNSDVFSLRLGITGRRLLGSMLAQSYKGMYLNNPEQVIPNWNASYGYPLRNDITSEILLGSLNYFFNHKRYSTMASLWQIDRQKKSAGSFTTGVTFSVTHLKGDSSFIPNSSNNSFSQSDRIVEGYNYLAGINAGYAYNFIFAKKFFFNALFIPGINLQYGKFELENKEIKTYSSTLGYHGDVRLIAGYNGVQYYSGVHYSNYFLSNRLESNFDVNI